MASEWRETTLDKLGPIVTGRTPPAAGPDAFGGTIPFVTPTDMDGRRIVSETGRYLARSGAASVSPARIPTGAVMVSCIGSDMGKAAIAGRDCVTNQQINSIVVTSGDDPLYVYYDLSRRKSEIRQAASGSAQPILNKSAFGRLPIRLPPPNEQRRIAGILGGLDDKIDLNRRMSRTLESMACALFQSWFVDFDPVRAKSEGRDPGLAPYLADLFPDSFDDSEVGEIPRGWRTCGLDEIADYLNGLALQRFPPNDGRALPVIKIAQLHAGNTDGADEASADIPSDYVVDDGDVLFSWSGSLSVELWCGGPGALNQHLFKVTSRLFPRWFYYQWTRQHLSAFREIAAGKATTMGHIQRQHLSDAKVTVPSATVLEALDLVCGPITEESWRIRVQARDLAAIRDSVLPVLLAGSPDTDTVIGSVVGR